MQQESNESPGVVTLNVCEPAEQTLALSDPQRLASRG